MLETVSDILNGHSDKRHVRGSYKMLKCAMEKPNDEFRIQTPPSRTYTFMSKMNNE